ncbi:MAG: hypothetical protein HY520_01045 [Candidatus Aenigmarchaeota archaeon]|nr:hypothetical protein [Candidatus Aenigmarchaeota archaeon]
MRAWIALATLLALLPLAGVRADTFLDTAAGDFAQGTFANTTLTGEAVTLAVESGAALFPRGNYTSRVFDAGSVVNWTLLAWTEGLPAGTDINISLRMGNISVPDESWGAWFPSDTGPSAVTGSSRYLQYAAFLAGDAVATPSLDDVSISFERPQPETSLKTPLQNALVTGGTGEFNCTASSPNALANITLWNDIGGTWHAEQTLPLAGSSAKASFLKAGIQDGTYHWSCEAGDGTGMVRFAAENRTVVFSSADLPPVFVTRSIDPRTAPVGGTVWLNVSVADDRGISMAWAAISYPNGSVTNVTLVNNGGVPFLAAVQGDYAVVFTANDSVGQVTAVADNFKAAPWQNFTLTVVGPAAGGQPANVTFLQGGRVVVSLANGTGSFSPSLLEDTYALRAGIAGNALEVTLEDVDTAGNAGKSLGLDILRNALGYAAIYAVSNPYGMSFATVRIAYNASAFANATFLRVRVCSTWDFASRSCTGNVFTLLPVTATLDLQANTLSFNVTGFSAFVIEQGSFCGDGICSGGETASSCPGDCLCTNGQTRACGGGPGVGECRPGVQTCGNGAWGPCLNEITATAEVCDQRDNDCDGAIDNVNGQTTPLGAQCACVNGALPQQEQCNNLDDDCDGLVDGFAAPCGSAIGACQEGTKTCAAGVFSACQGDIKAAAEMCGNALDEDCDNEADEDCGACANGLQDEGEFGVDCGGACARGCGDPPLPEGTGGGGDLATPAVAAVLVAGVALLVFRLRKRRGGAWGQLEQKYSYKPA